MDSAEREALLAARTAARGYVRLWWIQALRKSGAGLMARDVLAVLASYADDVTGKAWPGIEAIAALLGVRKNAVLVAIREIKAAGIMTTTPGNRKLRETNRYHLRALQVSESDTNTPPNQVSGADTNTKAIAGSGIRFVHDQVSDPDSDQVPGSCSNRVRNVPGNVPTNERTSENPEKDDDERHRTLVALVARCGFNGSADREARKALTQVDGNIDRLIGWLDYALTANSVKKPLAFAIANARGDKGAPPAPKPSKSPYPEFRGVSASGDLILE
jgi:hypothetical protein